MKFFPLSFTKALFVTAFLVVALSASSFAGPKTPKTEQQKKDRVAGNDRAQARKRDATAAGAGSSSGKQRGAKSSAVDPTLLNEGLAGATTPKTEKWLQGGSGQKGTPTKLGAGKQNFTGVPTPPGIAITAAANSKGARDQVSSASSMIEIPGPLGGDQMSHAHASLKADSKEVEFSLPAVVERKPFNQQQQEFQLALQEVLAKEKQPDVLSIMPAALEVPPAPPSTVAGTPVSAALTGNEDEDSHISTGVLREEEKKSELLESTLPHTAAAVADVEPKQEEQQKDERGYLTREAFVGLLKQDLGEWRAQLEAQDSHEGEGLDVKVSILTQAANAANRLLAKYNGPEMLSPDLSTEEPERIWLASIRMFRENQAGDGTNILPRKRMTLMEFDQEFYGAIKDVAEQALEYSASNNTDEARDSLAAMNYLDGYSQLRFDSDSLLSGVRYMILRHYEDLILRSSKPEEKGKIGFAPQGQGEALQTSSYMVWNFKESIESNKQILQVANSYLGVEPAERLEAASHLLLVEKEGTVTLQLPVSFKSEAQGGNGSTSLNGLTSEILYLNTHGSAIHGDIDKSRLNTGTSISRDNDNRSRFVFNGTLCRVLSFGSVAAIAAALAYEWYLQSLQASS
ncbi:MAG: hypothetical protein K2W97_08690 [Chthoniobacterales bacterium]|nr:hypothetical protein [Chthoniobacterales bacterium]